MRLRFACCLTWLVATMGTIVVGCGAGPRLEPADVEQRYPTRRYIASVGYAGTRSAAERAARTEVAGAVRSSIRARIVDVQKQSGDDFDDYTEQRIEQVSTFAHAELIRVEPSLTGCADGTCYAVAALDRRRAVQVLGAAYQGQREDFERTASAAEASEDVPRFSRELVAAQSAYDRLEPAAYQLDVITRGEAGELADVRKRLRGLQTKRDTLLRTTPFAVLRGQFTPDSVGDAARNALVGALSRLGLHPEIRESCATGYAVEPAGVTTCGRGQLGPQCKLKMKLRILRCPGDELARADLGKAKLIGTHPRDKARALQRLIGRLEPKLLVSPLRDALIHHLPLR